MAYLVLKYLHVLGATVLLGTGAGIAFFMLMAHLRGRAEVIAEVARMVVVADVVFTATAVVAQPITGVLLARAAGYDLNEGWIELSLLLYVVTGLLWLPVVWMQLRMRDLARAAAQMAAPLPPLYHRLFKAWVLFGVLGFGAVLAIIWLMVTRPDFSF